MEHCRECNGIGEHSKRCSQFAEKLKHQPIFDIFLKALTEHYATDGVAPGIVVAWLPDERVFYCSVRRYSQHRFAMRSNVVMSARSKLSSEAAVRGAMKTWKQEVLRPRQSNLNLFVAHDDNDWSLF